MSDFDNDKLIDSLERQAQPLGGLDNDYEAIIQAVQEKISVNDKEKIIVLMGEATHGTMEFYRSRAEITQRLIVEQGFDAVAIGADCPDASRVNRYVSGESDDRDADAALMDFERFPAWVWRNTEVHAFVQWLHHYNQTHRKDRGQRGQTETVGFYGLDCYNMTDSIEALLAHLDKTNPEEAQVARARYASCNEFISEPEACPQAVGLARGGFMRAGRHCPAHRAASHQSAYAAMEGPPLHSKWLHFCRERKSFNAKEGRTG